MEIIEKISEIKQFFLNTAITIGNFDGVHLGHQALFHEVIEKAAALKGISMAITFDPHPLKILKTGGYPSLLTLYQQKKELIAKTGMDVLVCIPFTKEFAGISASTFLDFLVQQLGMKAIVVGGDYSFGRNREGNINYLNAQAQRFDYEVMVAHWIQSAMVGTERISSTRIREFVNAGEMVNAGRMLGRAYQICAKVVAGRARGGKLLGFPTANLKINKDEISPQNGVYAVEVEWQSQKYDGVANIGYSPTFGDELHTIEVHILNFNANLYQQNIRVNFIKHIRDEIRFNNIDELIFQIKKDIMMVTQN